MKNRYLLYLFLLLITASFITFADIDYQNPGFVFEGNLTSQQPYLFVSLGCNCWPAWAMRAHGVRQAAFPFDWVLSMDNDKLIRCLNERFWYFNEEGYFVRYDKANKYYIENTHYGFKFMHDWPHAKHKITKKKHKQQLDFIKEKYSRRIARFENLKHFKGKVFFTRCFQVDPNLKGVPGWNTQPTKKLHIAKNF